MSTLSSYASLGSCGSQALSMASARERTGSSGSVLDLRLTRHESKWFSDCLQDPVRARSRFWCASLLNLALTYESCARPQLLRASSIPFMLGPVCDRWLLRHSLAASPAQSRQRRAHTLHPMLPSVLILRLWAATLCVRFSAERFISARHARAVQVLPVPPSQGQEGQRPDPCHQRGALACALQTRTSLNTVRSSEL